MSNPPGPVVTRKLFATAPPERSGCAVSAEELVRFVRSGPRYTSYPPATEFNSGFGEADADVELRRLGAGPDEGISLYCHVPYCYSLCWYCGCNVTVSRDRRQGTGYVDRLIREIGLVTDRIGVGRSLSELSLGGGSPNFLPSEDLVRLVAAVHSRFDLGADVQLGIELDPRDTEPEQVDSLADVGFTRLSVGVQDFDPKVQDAIHRRQSVEQTTGLIYRARDRGFGCINMDLVYGLPAQTPESLERTLDVVLEVRPDRIAMFGYAHLPHLRPHQKLVERGGIPDTTLRAELLSCALDRYREAGYVRVGLDHFALPDDALVDAALDGRLHRNFQGYVVRRGAALIGCGSSAITDSGTAYWQNHVDIREWSAAVDQGRLPTARGVPLDADDQVRRWVITRLMCDNELDMGSVDDRFGIEFEGYFADELERLGAEELNALVEVDLERRRIDATPIGCNLIRNVCMEFDRYSKRRDARFSMTI